MISITCHRQWMKRGAILLFWLLVWQLVAVMMDNSIILVTPLEVAKRAVLLLKTKEFYQVIAYSCVRIFYGLLGAWLLGGLLGAISYKVQWLKELIAPIIHLMKTVPVASFVILALIWIGSEKLTFFIVFVISMPIVYQGVITGLMETPKQLLEVAKVFRFSFWKKFWYLYRPTCIPFLMNSAVITVGLAWKSGIAAEVIGMPEHSIGERLYMAKISLETGDLFAWTAMIILCSYLFEKALLFILYRIAGKSYEAREDKKTI